MYRPFPSPRRGFVPNGHIFRPNFGPRKPYHDGFQTDFPNVNSLSENPTKEFWCETCDREFHTSQLLESHIQQHEKCNIDGCQFVAHSKVITKHIQMQHSSGLYNKIANLNNPEAINKWREERKKKYPTKSNIERKSAEIKEKIDRGEKMCLQKNKNQKSQPLMEKKGVKRKHEKRHQNEQNKMKNFKSNPTRSQPPKITKTMVTLANSKQLKPFSGIQNIFSNSDSEEGELESECNFQIDDDEDGTNETLQTNETSNKPALCGALSNLICNYGSSDDENDVSQKVNPTAITKDKKTEMQKENPNSNISKNCEDHISEDSGPEEIKNETGQQNIANDVYVKDALIKSKKLIPHLRQGKHGTIKKWKPKPPSTLLQKLLFSEMRQERNIVLQCIRHIIKNNYFEQD